MRTTISGLGPAVAMLGAAGVAWSQATHDLPDSLC